MYKLRIYYTKGINQGNLEREEFFETREEMENRYKELFNYNLFLLNPTAWEKVDNEWLRIVGF